MIFIGELSYGGQLLKLISSHATMHNFIDLLINGPARYAQAHDFNTLVTPGIVLGALFIELGIVYLLGLLIVFICQHTRSFVSWALRRCGVANQPIEYSFLQLIFPADTTKSAYATEQLHILLRNLSKYSGFWEGLAGRRQPYSLELVATKEQGIRYIIRIPAHEVEVVKRTLLSFLPGLKISEVEDYLPEFYPATAIEELRLSGDFVLPLNDNKAIAEHDPIAYLTGHMRGLTPADIVAYQIVAVPVFTNTHPNELRRAHSIEHRIALSKELYDKLRDNRINVGMTIFKVCIAPIWVVALGLKLIGGILDAIINNDLPADWKSGNKRLSGDPYAEELSTTIKSKLDQHLFEVSIRVLVVASDRNDAIRRLNAITSSFETFTSTRQSLESRHDLPFVKRHEKYLIHFRERTLSRHLISWPTILSASELADLYHFPNTDLTKTEGLVKSRSRDLPTPLSQKRTQTPFDLIVGANVFGGEMQEIGLTLQQRQKHMYILGKTGTGKTTLLKSSIYQDMVNGKGLAVFDPHGDMFRELLGLVPEHRRKDVVVFDPSDREYPVGLNILDPGIEFANEDDKHEWITSAVLSVFAKLADEKQWGPRMEHILRNTTLTALQTPHPTLYTLQRLLTDKKYQREVAKDLKDPVLKQFWEKEFKLMGTMQMSSATAPLTHRLGHFITAKMSRHILLQEKSTVRIADIMNEGKILLVNLSKGDIGEDQSFFFGTILTSFIWMAAYQRTKIPEKQRRDFFVYVDEFQNFATPQFGAITSEGRKFHISLIVSHQTISQMADKDLVKVIAGNAATMLCLRASPQDEEFILPYMKPEVEKSDIVNLAPYHFYMKVTSDESEEAFSGETVPLDIEENEDTARSVIKSSRKAYATIQKIVEEKLAILLDSTGTEKKATIGKQTKRTSGKKILHDV